MIIACRIKSAPFVASVYTRIHSWLLAGKPLSSLSPVSGEEAGLRNHSLSQPGCQSQVGLETSPLCLDSCTPQWQRRDLCQLPHGRASHPQVIKTWPPGSIDLSVISESLINQFQVNLGVHGHTALALCVYSGIPYTWPVYWCVYSPEASSY